MSGVVYGEMETKTVTMDSDLSTKTYYAVNLDTTDEDNVNIAAGATVFPYLLIEGAVGASGAKKGGTIGLSGRSKAKVGGTVAPGDKLTSNGSGLWITTVTDKDHYGAVALEIGAANDVIAVQLERGTVSAT